MKVYTRPKVQLIARPSLNKEEIDKFILEETDQRNGWIQEDGPRPGGESLIEFSGRQCYGSFGKKQGRMTNKEYLQNIIEMGHGCYDGRTDVLTSEGWKKWENVTKKDKLATMTNNILSYDYPKRLIKYNYEGPMYRVKSRQVDLLVTPNHRMVATITSTLAGRKNRKLYQLLTAEYLDDKPHNYIKTCNWVVKPSKNLSLELMEILGFSIGDGHFDGSSLRFHLRRPRKIAYLKRIAVKLKWRLSGNKDRFNLSVPKKLRLLFVNMYGLDKQKQIPDGILLYASRAKLKGLLKGLLQSDGSKSPTGHHVYDTTSFKLADQFQQLCLHCGYASNKKHISRDKSFGKKPLFRMSVVTRELWPEVNKYKGHVGRTNWVKNWKGKVFCAEISGETLYVRRDGKPVWSGNSVLEHSNYSFLVTRCSRTMANELVRHRAGWAYSQESQHFIDYSDPSTWNLCLDQRLSPEEQVCLIQAAKSAYEAYAKVYASLLKAGMNKKGACAAARQILPGGVESKIVFTANARALRHFLEYRGTKNNVLEIRMVAIEVLKIMKIEAPNIFYDIELIKAEDGYEEIVSRHRKV